MATESGTPAELNYEPMPELRGVGTDAPLRWLKAGWHDVRRAPAPSLFYGVVLAAMGAILVNTIAHGAVGLALMTGFLIVGPFLLMGLYDIARRLEHGAPVRLADTMIAWRANIPAVGFLAMILALMLAVWVRVSIVVVALFFPRGTPKMGQLLRDLLSSAEGWTFIGAYLAAGAGFALFVFAAACVSLPMMLDRPKVDTLTAIIASFNAVRTSFKPMLLWGLAIAVLVAFGFLTWFVGLVVVLPVIGCATWHAYREIVAPRQTPG